MHKLSQDQRSVVARVLNRFAVQRAGTEFDFYVLRALELWIAGNQKPATPLRSIQHLRVFG